MSVLLEGFLVMAVTMNSYVVCPKADSPDGLVELAGDTCIVHNKELEYTPVILINPRLNPHNEISDK